MNIIKKIDHGLPNRPVEENPRGNGSIKTVSGETDTQARTITPYEPLLRERFDVIQRTKHAAGIVTQAAIEPGTIITGAIIAYFLGRHADIFVRFMQKNIIDPLDTYWNDDLLSQDPLERERAISNLRDRAKLSDPVKNIKDVEYAIREVLLSSREVPESELHEMRHTLRGLFSALEALYQRKEAGIYLGPKMGEHGWQRHSEILSGIQWVTGVGKAIADNLLSPRLMKKALQPYFGLPDLTHHRGWYAQNNACDVLVNLLENSAVGMFPIIDNESRESMRRILVLNWRAPVQDYKIPNIRRSIQYRLGIYQTILATLINPLDGTSIDEDPLFLKTRDDKIPAGLRQYVNQLRNGLVTALKVEINEYDREKSNFSKPVVDTIKAILTQSKQIPPHTWSLEAAREKEINEENNRRFDRFKGWAASVCALAGSELKSCFDSLNQKQKEALITLDTQLRTSSYSSAVELNARLSDTLDLMDLDSQVEGVKLTKNNSEKGLFFLGYLNTLVEKKISVEGKKPSAFKEHINKENRNRLLDTCRTIVHDRQNFQATTRDISFFTNPSLLSVPGQALALHHKLTYCISEEGYRDRYGLRELILPNAVEVLSDTAKRRGFIISSPHKTDTLSFAVALANQLAVDLFEVNRELVHSERSTKASGFEVIVQLPNGKTGTIENFVDYAILNSPCVVYFGDADKLLVPRKEDQGRDTTKEPTEQEEDLTGKFLSNLDKLHNEAPGVILIMATDQPPTDEINVAQLNDKGYSDEARQALFRYVSYGAIRGGRVDHKTFLPHKAKGEAAKPVGTDETSRIQIYLQDKLPALQHAGRKKLEGSFDYPQLAKAATGLSPQQIKTALEDLTPETLTQANILAAFEKVRGQ